MANTEMEIEVSVAWWVGPYINILAFLCTVTGSEPDMAKVERVIQRGIRLKAVFE
jgi:hypothetical protein